MEDNKLLQQQVNMATKWSTITQIFIKLITPITNMILARLLAPEAFGVVASITMIISFTDMFTDAGFQKYLVQHKFKDEEEKLYSADVAFWTNLAISIFLWIIITIFKDGISELIGNPGYGNVLAIACIQLPLTAFSTIQVAILRRSFNFKLLFYVQSSVAIIPLIITVPLAWKGLGYWSIIIGNICGYFCQAIILGIVSEWKPKKYYDIQKLKEMISFSAWTLVETILVWLTTWIDMLIISKYLDVYYLGLYRNSFSMVNSLLAIITASITPILFVTLSRLQDDKKQFTRFFLSNQKIIAYLVFPMGVGLFLYRDLATSIMFGNKWGEASAIVGIMSLTSAIRIVMVSIYSEVYRAKGKPKLCALLQLIDLIIIIPVCILSLKKGFWSFVCARSLVRLDLIIPGLIIMNNIIHIKWNIIIGNLLKPLQCTIIMMCVACILQAIQSNIMWEIFSIGICIVVYIGVMYIVARKDFRFILNSIRNKMS